MDDDIVKRLQEDNDQLELTYKSYEKELIQSRKRFASERSEFTKRIKQLETEIETLQDDHAQKVEELQKAQQRASEAEHKLHVVKDQSASIQKMVTLLQQRIDLSESKLQAMEASNARQQELEENCEKLKHELELAVKCINKLHQQSKESKRRHEDEIGEYEQMRSNMICLSKIALQAEF